MAKGRPENNRRPKILIVDDVELNRAMLGEMFHARYTIYEAENGREAMNILKEQGGSMEAVLLDIVMPVLDGFGVLKEMAEHGWISRIPVIMITAENSDSAMRRGYELGATDIICKPFNPNIVRRRIENIMEQFAYRLHLEQLVAEQTQRLRENSGQIINMLIAIIEFKNVESVNHIYNIRTLTRILLTELSKRHGEYRLSPDLIDMISQAAAMHDIGKIAIPDRILNKPGRLTPEEFEIMKTHSVLGCEMLKKLSETQRLSYYDYCYEICRHHHERWDGSGYPDGLVGNETPIWTQVVSLADAYDALTSKRVYKDAYSSEEAVRMIVNAECGTFNPLLLESFLAVVPTLKERMQHAYQESSVLPATVPPLRDTAAELSDRTLRLLEIERKKYQVLSELSSELLFEYDCKTDCLTFSDKYQKLTGRNPTIQRFDGSGAFAEAVTSEGRERIRKEVLAITPSDPARMLEMRIKLNGSFEWYEIHLCPLWESEPEDGLDRFVGKLINIEEQKRKNLLLQEAVYHDPLTGVLNRKAMQDKITYILEQKEDSTEALCFIDIDNFKSINDTFGHVFGDTVLKRVTAVLNSCTRKTDLVGRIGGDEFMIFFRNIGSKENLLEKVSKVCRQLCHHFDGCNISGSMGVSCYPQDGQSYSDLLYRADQALYLSKRMGKNGYQFYNADCKDMPFRSLLSQTDDYQPE